MRLQYVVEHVIGGEKENPGADDKQDDVEIFSYLLPEIIIKRVITRAAQSASWRWQTLNGIT